MPILQLDDPDYCEFGCPICTNARKGSRLAKVIQKIEVALTFGGCPWGRARKRKYGVNPDETVDFHFIPNGSIHSNPLSVDTNNLRKRARHLLNEPV